VYHPATRRVVNSRNVDFDEVVVVFIGESCRALEVQRNYDEEDNTPDSRNTDSRNLCGEAPDRCLGESPLRKTQTGVGSRLGMNGV
jgi:hypothetical protein